MSTIVDLGKVVGPQGPQGPRGPQGPSMTVDSALSTTSTNPVQNKVITNSFGAKQPWKGNSNYIGVYDVNNFLSGVALVPPNSSNTPNKEQWWLIVAAGANNTRIQLAFELWTGAYYQRYMAGGSWGKWMKKVS